MSSAPKTTARLVYAGMVLALLLTTFCPTAVSAQIVGGTVSGTITDNSGALIPHATIVMENTATGVATTVQSNSQGLFSVPNLLPGPYQEKVSAQGFQTVLRTGITVTTGAQLNLNTPLAVGSESQKVVVNDIPPDLQLE